MSTKVQRYTFGYVRAEDGEEPELRLIPATFGEAVKHADYVALEALAVQAAKALANSHRAMDVLYPVEPPRAEHEAEYYAVNKVINELCAALAALRAAGIGMGKG